MSQVSHNIRASQMISSAKTTATVGNLQVTPQSYNLNYLEASSHARSVSSHPQLDNLALFESVWWAHYEAVNIGWGRRSKSGTRCHESKIQYIDALCQWLHITHQVLLSYWLHITLFRVALWLVVRLGSRSSFVDEYLHHAVMP